MFFLFIPDVSASLYYLLPFSPAVANTVAIYNFFGARFSTSFESLKVKVKLSGLHHFCRVPI
jgi:hypothetical protein